MDMTHESLRFWENTTDSKDLFIIEAETGDTKSHSNLQTLIGTEFVSHILALWVIIEFPTSCGIIVLGKNELRVIT